MGAGHSAEAIAWVECERVGSGGGGGPGPVGPIAGAKRAGWGGQGEPERKLRWGPPGSRAQRKPEALQAEV